jgi:uncharacterized protein YcbX
VSNYIRPALSQILVHPVRSPRVFRVISARVNLGGLQECHARNE